MIRTLLTTIAAAAGAALLSACVGPGASGGSGSSGSLPPFAPYGDPFFDPAAAAAAAQSGCAEAWDSAHGDAGGRHVRGAPGRADEPYWDPESGRYRSVRDQFERVREMHGPRYGVHSCIFEDQRSVVQDGG